MIRRRVWIAVSVLLAAGALGGPLVTEDAGAASPAESPAVYGGVAWCGHYDHAGAGTLPAGFRCARVGASTVSLVTDAPDGPFSSSQYVNVVVAPNAVLHPGKRIYIRECAAPGGKPPTSWRQCDTKTTQSSVVTVGAGGTVDFDGYPIYALPDSMILGEGPRHKPVCDLTHACILFVGQDRHDFDRPHVWSLPFFVHPSPGDSGVDPGNGLPEVPYVLALPILAVGIFGASVAVRRRRGRVDHP